MTQYMREKVLQLQNQLATALKELFVFRLNRMFFIDETRITHVEFNMYDVTNWHITYIHDNTLIKFGRAGTYFITGGRDLCVYKNSAGLIRVKDPHSTHSLYDQLTNIIEYSYNVDNCEYIAIRFFHYMNDHSWDDNSIVVHFSIV